MSTITHTNDPTIGPEMSYHIIDRARAPLWEQAIVALWFLSTFVTFPGNEYVLYPLAAYFAGMIALRRREIVPVLLKAWPLLLLPILVGLSMFWSVASSEALRLGVMMILTAAIAAYIAVRLTPRQVIQALFVVGAALVLIHVPHMDTYYTAGVFFEKNIYANRVMISLVAALAVAYDRDNAWPLRIVAGGVALAAFALILRAESATNFVFSLGAIIALSGVWLIWSRFDSIPHLRSLMLIMIAASGLVFTLILLNTPDADLTGEILGALEKDTTLTGRTDLWIAAERIAKENPWLGVGAGGFWQYQVGQAQTLLELSFKEYGTQFSFHNSYLETQVHLGYVGLALLILIVVWTSWQNAIGWLREQNMTRSFFLLITGISVTVSFTESYLLSAFDTTVMLLYIGAMSAIALPQKVIATPTDAALLR